MGGGMVGALWCSYHESRTCQMSLPQQNVILMKVELAADAFIRRLRRINACGQIFGDKMSSAAQTLCLNEGLFLDWW